MNRHQSPTLSAENQLIELLTGSDHIWQIIRLGSSEFEGRIWYQHQSSTPVISIRGESHHDAIIKLIEAFAAYSDYRPQLLDNQTKPADGLVESAGVPFAERTDMNFQGNQKTSLRIEPGEFENYTNTLKAIIQSIADSAAEKRVAAFGALVDRRLDDQRDSVWHRLDDQRDRIDDVTAHATRLDASLKQHDERIETLAQQSPFSAGSSWTGTRNPNLSSPDRSTRVAPDEGTLGGVIFENLKSRGVIKDDTLRWEEMKDQRTPFIAAARALRQTLGVPATLPYTIEDAKIAPTGDPVSARSRTAPNGDARIKRGEEGTHPTIRLGLATYYVRDVDEDSICYAMYSQRGSLYAEGKETWEDAISYLRSNDNCETEGDLFVAIGILSAIDETFISSVV